jgi:ATP-binding cassette subfamily B protein
VQSAIMSVGLAVMAVLAGYEAAAGRLGVGDVTAAVLILLSLYAPAQHPGLRLPEVRQSFIDMEAMVELGRQNRTSPDAPDAANLPARQGRGGDSVFESVSYRHQGRRRGAGGGAASAPAPGPPRAGRRVRRRQVHHARLALRLIDPPGGAGAAGRAGPASRAARLAAARAALVPQDVALFNDTLYTNIAFADPEATPSRCGRPPTPPSWAASSRRCRTAFATKVGERGLKLSGGERQRVGIARALLADPRC